MKRALESYGKPTTGRNNFETLKAELMAILTSPTLGQSGAFGDAGQTGSFTGTAGPLTGVRVGALGKVTGIPAAELARTTADDYGASVDAIDSATNAFEYDLGVSDMIGARFNRKLEAMWVPVAPARCGVPHRLPRADPTPQDQRHRVLHSELILGLPTVGARRTDECCWSSNCCRGGSRSR